MDIAEAVLRSSIAPFLSFFLRVCHFQALTYLTVLNKSPSQTCQAEHTHSSSTFPEHPCHMRGRPMALREQEEVVLYPAEVETMQRKDLHSIKTGQRRVKCLSPLPMMKACPDVTC